MDLRASSSHEAMASPAETSRKQTHLLLLKRVEESVAKVQRESDPEYVKTMSVLRCNLETFQGDLITVFQSDLIREKGGSLNFTRRDFPML